MRPTDHDAAEASDGRSDADWAVEVSGLVQRLHGVEILSGVSLHAEFGEVYGLIGPNGAGKTTTLHTVVGALEPVDGRVRLLGRRPAADPSARASVGVVFEHETLNPRWSVADNLRHTCAVTEVSPRRIDEALRSVDLDPAERSTAFGDLSNGMQRKASIANALVVDPDVLVLDEPTSGLDPRARRTTLDLLDDLREAGRTILLSSHDLDDVASLCDRVGVIVDGSTVAETPLDDPIHVGDVTLPGGRPGRDGAPPALDRDAVTGPDGERVDVESLYFAATGEEQTAGDATDEATPSAGRGSSARPGERRR